MSIFLNGNEYEAADFIGAQGRGYQDINPDTDLPFFPDSIFTDMLAEIDNSLSAYDISGFMFRILDSTNAAGTQFGMMIVRNVTFADDFSGSFAEAQVGALNERIFFIDKNDIEVGRLTFPTGGQTNGVFTTTGAAITFLVGDKLTMRVLGSDANLDAISFTLKGG